MRQDNKTVEALGKAPGKDRRRRGQVESALLCKEFLGEEKQDGGEVKQV